MKYTSTLFLKTAVIAIGLGVLLLCIFALPKLSSEVPENVPGEFQYVVYSIVVAMYAASVPYFIGLYHAWRLLTLVDKNRSFTITAVNRLQTVAWCAASISAIYAVAFPFFYTWGEQDDAPGMIVIGMVMVGMPLVVSVCAGLLQRLLKEAVDIKSENELTV